MKKLLFALALVLPTIGLVGCDRVEPGNVGIKVNKLGDDKASVKWSVLGATGRDGTLRFTSSRPLSR